MGKSGLLGNNAQFVSGDLIGEKNQVLLELVICVGLKVQENLYITDTQGTEGICPL